VVLIYIDRYKPTHDRDGHAIGDKVLRAVANRLTSGIRDMDTLARFGGDELVLVMPNTGLYVA
jgi:diguanylate cyclase (GGDEF)-like protein